MTYIANVQGYRLVAVFYFSVTLNLGDNDLPTTKEIFEEILEQLPQHPAVEREPILQRFFEKNPECLIGTDFLTAGVMISKLEVGPRITDFTYIEETSGGHFICFIEIKEPSLKIFTDEGNEFSAEFNHALQQVHDCISWANKNKDPFRQVYDDIDECFDQKQSQDLEARGKLIYGRRSQLKGSPIRKSRWAQKKEHARVNGVELMTYDGLMNSARLAFALNPGQLNDVKTYSYSKRTFNLKI